jgi:hypothetical protein
MIWIICIIIFIVIVFSLNKSEENSKIKSQGGMKYKYHTLIEGLSDHPSAKIEFTSTSSVWILVKDNFSSTEFRIDHGFSDFTVYWTHQSYAFGKHNLQWKFVEYTDQRNATKIILNDVDEYSLRLIGKTL